MGKRLFTLADQQAFASLTGDYNPIHLDPLFSRRTQAGAPIVHGIHAVLWLLDRYAESSPRTKPFQIRARFFRMIHLDSPVEAILLQESEDQAKLALHFAGHPAIRLRLGFQPVPAQSPLLGCTLPQAPPDYPLARTLAQLDGLSGCLPLTAAPSEVLRAWPGATDHFGCDLLQVLCATSTLVGMIAPGLHGLYQTLTITRSDGQGPADALSFRVRETDARFQTASLEVNSRYFSGALETLVRPTPVVQPAMSEVARSVDPGEFAGVRALIVGGSRGLGELLAKVFAAGGGFPTLTYYQGRDEAEAVAKEILGWGGQVNVRHLDVTAPTSDWDMILPPGLTHVGYFATPQIFRPRNQPFEPEWLEAFHAYYCRGLQTLVEALTEIGQTPTILVPSTEALDQPLPGLEEYAAAKAAGEYLCRYLVGQHPGVRFQIERLPRILTDQTATVREVAVADGLAEVIRIARQLVRAPWGRPRPENDR